jgi:hypothetical protein
MAPGGAGSGSPALAAQTAAAAAAGLALTSDQLQVGRRLSLKNRRGGG